MSTAVGVVEAVNDDGTVTVTVRGGLLGSLPASPSYDPRQVGDRVLVEFRGGSAVVVGRGAGPLPVTPAAVSDPWKHTLVDVAPGAGFEEAASVWVNPSTREVRYVRAAPAPAATTGTLTVSVAGLASYRDGGLVGDDRAEQGTWGGYGPHRGLFLYPSGAFGALTGKTIARVRVRLRRMNQGGIIAAVRIHVGTHTYTTAPASTPTISDIRPLTSLARNQTATVDCPKSWGEQLRDGTRKGLGVYHSTDNAELDQATLIIDWSA